MIVLRNKSFSTNKTVTVDDIKKSYRPVYFHENGEVSKPNKFDEKSLKELGESIAKHRAKANELRAKKATGILLKRVGTGAAIATGAAGVGIAAKKLYDKKKEKSYSVTKKGPKFPPGFHFDARDKNGKPTCIPAYIDENGDAKELTKEVWEKYRPDINKY